MDRSINFCPIRFIFPVWFNVMGYVFHCVIIFETFISAKSRITFPAPKSCVPLNTKFCATNTFPLGPWFACCLGSLRNEVSLYKPYKVPLTWIWVWTGWVRWIAWCREHTQLFYQHFLETEMINFATTIQFFVDNKAIINSYINIQLS